MNYVHNFVFFFSVVEYLSGSDRHLLVSYPATPWGGRFTHGDGSEPEKHILSFDYGRFVAVRHVSSSAILIAFNIGYTELVDISQMAFTPSRFLIAALLTYLLMAIMIILGVLYPALQSMKVQPAEALRDE